ncbi:hypothetical protein CGRA01v4_02429 [Colletotrichum graminicola]|nr:hypothetical protein CGRA01v4_02429 [Colletotrichum graminicola]
MGPDSVDHTYHAQSHLTPGSTVCTCDGYALGTAELFHHLSSPRRLIRNRHDPDCQTRKRKPAHFELPGALGPAY